MTTWFRRWYGGRTIRRRIARTKRREARCHSCGLLGFYTDPEMRDGSMDRLLELPTGQRSTLGGELGNARKAGRIKHEFDFRQQPDLGRVDWLQGGVRCGVGDHRGPRSTWSIRRDQDVREFLAMWGDNGAVVTIDDPESRGILGNVIGVVQTFRWPLVRPHDCPYFMKHVPGRTPHEHIELRESRRSARIKNAIYLAAAILAAAVALIVGLRR